ncbi:MAG TPA: universal stress protein [Duganella sp.]|nr:universal stress protein [Duganella sp.]
MFKSILLPTDGSELSDKATTIAIDFARLHQARIVTITVIQPMLLPSLGDSGAMLSADQFQTQMQNAARHHIEKVTSAARAAGIPCEGIIAMSPNPYEEIVEAASKHGCDLIMMASHGRKGLNKLFLGSETQRVLSHTTLPVLVLR